MSEIKAGSVVRTNFGNGKRRPWLVAWVDEDEDAVGVIALTSKEGYIGSVATGHLEFKTAAAWAQVQPLHFVRVNCHVLGQFTRKQRATVSAGVLAALDLGD